MEKVELVLTGREILLIMNVVGNIDGVNEKYRENAINPIWESFCRLQRIQPYTDNLDIAQNPKLDLVEGELRFVQS